MPGGRVSLHLPVCVCTGTPTCMCTEHPRESSCTGLPESLHSSYTGNGLEVFFLSEFGFREWNPSKGVHWRHLACCWCQGKAKGGCPGPPEEQAELLAFGRGTGREWQCCDR